MTAAVHNFRAMFLHPAGPVLQDLGSMSNCLRDKVKMVGSLRKMSCVLRATSGSRAIYVTDSGTLTPINDKAHNPEPDYIEFRFLIQWSSLTPMRSTLHH